MRFRSVLFVALLAASALSMAADPKVEDLLAKMRDAYKSVKTASLEVAATVTEENAKGETSKGEATAKVLYEAPSKVRVELTPKDQSTDSPFTAYYVQDGKRMALGPAPDKLKARDYDEDAFPIQALNLETVCFWQWDKQLSTAEGKNMHDSELVIVDNVDWDGKKWTTLEESAPKSKVFVRYYIDPKTYFIWRCEIKELDSMKPLEDVWLTKLETGAKIDEAQFKVPASDDKGGGSGDYEG